MFCKLIRLGRDAELRSTPAGTQLLQFSGVYDVGYGDKKKGQWIDCVIWGKQAEALSSYLTKGSQIVIYAEDLEVETWEKDGSLAGAKLKCKVTSIDFAGGGSKKEGQQGSPQPSEPPFIDDTLPF